MCVNNTTFNTKSLSAVAMGALVLVTIAVIALAILLPAAAPVAIAAPVFTATIFGLTGSAAVAVMMSGFFLGMMTLLFICAMVAQACQRLQQASKHGGDS